MRADFCLSDANVFHYMLWHFISGSYWKHHDSSPITLSKKLFPLANWQETE
jgi:hypothetical protein